MLDSNGRGQTDALTITASFSLRLPAVEATRAIMSLPQGGYQPGAALMIEDNCINYTSLFPHLPCPTLEGSFVWNSKLVF